MLIPRILFVPLTMVPTMTWSWSSPASPAALIRPIRKTHINSYLANSKVGKYDERYRVSRWPVVYIRRDKKSGSVTFGRWLGQKSQMKSTPSHFCQVLPITVRLAKRNWQAFKMRTDSGRHICCEESYLWTPYLIPLYPIF
jgi:hypothetical protein